MIHLYKGRRVFYKDLGAGSTIVLLHGYLETSEVWSSFEKKLAEEFRVLSVDLPGHGLSGVFGETHTMEFMADVLKDLLDSLRLNKVFLIGHSLGGYVALAFLEHFPDYLSGYCLFHSQPFPDTQDTIEKRLREISIVRAGKKDLMYPDNVTRMFAPSNLLRLSEALQKSKDIASEISGEGIIAVLNGMIQRPSRIFQVEEGRVPFLWILGSMDSYIPCEAIQKKISLPSNATVIVLQNSGHLGFIEEEKLSLKAIRDFVKKYL